MANKSKIEMQGLLERVIAMYVNEHVTLTDIAKTLQDEGYDVSRTGVYRVIRTNEELIKEQRLVQEHADAFLKEFRNSPNTDVSEINLQIMQRNVFNALRDLDFSAYKFEDPTKLANLVARLADSQVNLSRLRVEFNKGVDAAKDKIEKSLRVLLKEKDPELLLKLVTIVQEMKVENSKRG
ncbi:phage protein Gp27 family protein [Enterovibrio nigricans]|uniref:DUF3486 family protein n=1 Tax=Enterovibrio nigricans DSM 22720 TaxID=1121868 RepID=A0A1T4UVB4_9GAMM|nr:phage protein Gp27 family protein [Enterovibrio nigricans]PKF50918.1 DUF3486 domain-containing protein [Enterovibrio nigricans]SKA56620.1 Protein of unknown function [Enterovibrio nigricans DSM 22720]